MAIKIVIGLVIVLVLLQFIRPEKNTSNDLTYDVSTEYEVPEDVQHILNVACNDCHSNKTVYPWYFNIQPVAFWMNNHIRSGKRHLNFSDFTQQPLARQYHKFEETVEMIEENEMPLSSYTYFGMHQEANLTDQQKQTLITWAQTQMDFLKANYPADSLIRRRRGPRPEPGD